MERLGWADGLRFIGRRAGRGIVRAGSDHGSAVLGRTSPGDRSPQRPSPRRPPTDTSMRSPGPSVVKSAKKLHLLRYVKTIVSS